MSKRWAGFICILLTTLLLVSPVLAQDFSFEDSDQASLLIATMDNSTISIDRILFMALRNISYRADFVTPIIRVGHTGANDGIYDGVIAAYPNIHHIYPNLLQVPVPLEKMTVSVFAAQGSEMRINTWDELDGLHIGMIDHRAYITDNLPAGVTITSRPTNLAVLDALEDGEFDVAVLGIREHETFDERLNVTRIGDVAELTDYLYLNKQHEAIIPQLTASLEALFNDGTANRLLNDLPMPELNQRKTVVHILSSSIEVNREDMFNEQLRKPFEDDMSIEWMTVNLDSTRFTRGQYSNAQIASLLRSDLLSRNVAAVIISGDTALEFIQNYYYIYFRNVPVLFYGVSERSLVNLQDCVHRYHFTGIAKSIEAYEMIDSALNLFPDTNRIFVVNDYTPEGLSYRYAMEKGLEPFTNRLTIEFNENVNAVALMETINNLPEDSLLFIGSYFIDADHQYFSASESKRLLERYCSVPIISFYSTELPYNAIGGKCLDYQRYGEEIAGMLKKLFDGSHPADIPIVYDATEFNRWVFDQIQMDIFSIDASALPEGAEILNRIPSLRESNLEFFIAVVILSAVSFLLVLGIGVFLVVNRKHNIQNEKLRHDLMVEKSMLETIFNSVPEILFVKDLQHRFVRINKKFEEHFGCSGEKIIGTNGYGNELLTDIIDRWMDTEEAVVREGRLIMSERSIKGVDGNSPYFEIIATPLRSDGIITGIVGAAYDITHRKEMEEAAQAASRAKSNFLANMSHEMRTPLTAVLGLAELTLETVQLDDETRSNLIKIFRSGETILSLVNDILDISKIEADRLELNLSRYDLPSLLNDTITQSMLYIGEKPIELVLNIKEDLPNYLYGDELRIKQILCNLLSNSFKFTREGMVELGMQCQRDGDDVWMTAWVRDTGVGIRAEDMDKLFTLYGKMEEVNTDSRANRRTEGTGLGLSISKKIAEMMDGSITVESEYGKGSVFTVKLRQTYVSDTVIDSGVIESLKSFDYSLQRFESAKITRINLSYAKVLVVDDNPTNLDVAKGLMRLYGMTVDCVNGGQEAVDTIRNERSKYDAVFMDHMMPVIDGLEATRIIREEINTEYAKNVPIIALTANAIMGNEEMFLSKGFQAFIAKPIDLAQLDLVLRKFVRNKDAEALLENKIISVQTRQGMEKQMKYKDIPGLDVAKGIAHFGFSEDAYFMVLESFVKNTRLLLDSIREVGSDSLTDYAVIVHGIKGSSRGILADELGDEAEALENAAVRGDYDYVTANNQRFLDMTLRLFADIEDSLLNYDSKQKPVKDKPDSMLLSGFLKACNDFDIDEMDRVMTEMEFFEYTSDDGLTIWLRECLDQGKYKDIQERLSVLLPFS